MSHHKAPHGLWEFAKRHEHLFNDEKIPEPNSLYENGKHGPLKVKDMNLQFLTGILEEYLHQVTREGWPTGIIDTLGMTKREKIHSTYQKCIRLFAHSSCYRRKCRSHFRIILMIMTLAKNTIVIYTSDQGQLLGEHDYFDKRWMYEESF